MRRSLWVAALLSIVFSAAAWMSEETIFSKYGDMVFRPDSTTLCIITFRGDTLVFEDSWEDITCAEDFTRYRVIDYLEDMELWVLEADGYEWVDWRLVNGVTGAVDTAISAPLPSPDNTRLLCCKEDLTAGFIPNGVQIWRAGPEGLVLEFQDVSVPWGPTEAGWEDDSTVTLVKMSFDWDSGEYSYEPGRLELGRDGSWVPDDPDDWMYPD